MPFSRCKPLIGYASAQGYACTSGTTVLDEIILKGDVLKKRMSYKSLLRILRIIHFLSN